MSDPVAVDAPKKATVTITVDGKEIEADPGELVIAAAQRHGIYIPRFCYHERMDPVGMCRMCLVDIDAGRGPALGVSCMVTVTEGMKVDTEGDRVKKAQEGVLEFLLLNHPLDCPVCDKGGECPLQDQTLTHGPAESRLVEEKRHFEKPIAISDLVYLDRERCILCDRCTRFAKDVAGDPLIHFVERGNQTQVMTFPDAPFASYFSGNTVQICPVGALTAKPYRFKARPWDLEQTESTCTTCSVGCRIAVQDSRNVLLRYQGVDSDPVNWGWLCDKGRFAFEAVNSSERLRAPLIRKGSDLVEVPWSEALRAAADALQQALSRGGPGSIALIGGARGTNEDAYAWAKLAKGVLGTDHVDAQLGDGLDPAFLFGLPRATITEAASATTVVLLGPDLKEELPVLYLRLRDSAERRRTRLLELAGHDSGLTRYAWKSLRHRPGELATVVRAMLEDGGRRPDGVTDGDIDEIREQFAKGDVVVVAGRPSVAEAAVFTEDALARLLAALPGAKFLPLLRRGNVHGALDLGLAPGLLPGAVRLEDAGDELQRHWPLLPAASGLDAAGILAAAADGRVNCLVLLGADPLSDFPDRGLAQRALEGAGHVIAVDTFVTDSSARADVVLAAAAFAEKAGTTTNLEGRVSTLSQKVTAVGTAHADWMIAADLAARLGHDLGFLTVDDVWAEIQAVSPRHASLDRAALLADHDGILAGPPGSTFTVAGSDTAAPPLKGYGFRLATGRRLHDAGVAVTRSPSLAPLARAAALHLNPWDADHLGERDGTAVRVASAHASVNLPLVRDAGVPRGVAWIPTNQPDLALNRLLAGREPVNDITVETLSGGGAR
jgi:NADH-quinone oxidoreductase subunit G